MSKTMYLQKLKGMQSSKLGRYVKGVTFVNKWQTKGYLSVKNGGIKG